MKNELKTLQITKKTKWDALQGLIFFIVIGLGFIIYYEFNIFVTLFILLFFVIDFTPAIILYLRYHKRNKDQIILINEHGFTYQKKGANQKFYPKEQIHHVKIFASPGVMKNSWFHNLSIGPYHYARVYLKDNTQLVVTSLMTSYFLEWHFRLIPNIIIRKKVRFYCFL